jgi:hypothetical protein
MDLRRCLLTFAACAAAAAIGCAHRDWRRALDEDNAAAYHRFLREHPGSGHADEARARLAFVQLRAKPTHDGFQKFVAEHGDSGLVDDLRPHVEAGFFEQARAIGSAQSYRGFLEDFGDGAFAARARGNAEYLERRGFDGDPAALAAFAAEHPESDFAPEAQRSVASLRTRGTTGFARVGLVIEIDATTPGADRLRRALLDRALAAYRPSGLALIPLTSREDPAVATLGAVLTISHREQPMRSQLERDTVTQSALVAETRVTLVRVGATQPIWQDVITHRAPISTQRPDESMLFAAGATAYWNRFFVPIASWQTRDAIRAASELQRPAVGIDAAEGRAVVLFGDGGFQVFDIADPAQPLVVADYRRARDLARFEGVAAYGDRVAVFGQDGLELVRIGDGGAVRERVFPRDVVGSPVGVVGFADGLALAGKRGLLWIGNGASAPRTLVAKPIVSLARVGEHLLFTDGAKLYVATLQQLVAGRVAAELELGRGFAPSRIRVHGDRVAVMGERGVLCFDARDPGRLVLRSRLEMNEVGQVRDAAFVEGRIFLLGDRGLQVVDASGERVIDSVDVAPRQLLDAGGRHLVLAGDRSLEVVDATPLVAPAPAARDASR